MEQLTEKQIYAREYYRKNAKKICQQKRNDYTSKKPKSKKTTRSPLIVKKVKQEIINPPKHATAADIARANTRKRIEDIELVRELGINLEDL